MVPIYICANFIKYQPYKVVTAPSINEEKAESFSMREQLRSLVYVVAIMFSNIP